MIPVRRGRSVVIANAVGWGNFGDDLLAVTAADLFRSDPRVRGLSLLSGPHRAFESFDRSTFVDWNHRLSAGYRLVRAGAVVIAGGGLLTDYLHRPYLRASKLCAATGGRIVVSSVGVFGERPSEALVECLQYLASEAAHFTVRDRSSADLVARITGLTPPIVPDLAFGLSVPSIDDAVGRDIGVCVRPWWFPRNSVDARARMERMVRVLARHLRRALEAAPPGARIRLIPFHIATEDDDRPLLLRLKTLLGEAAELCEPESAGDAIRAVRRCRVLLGMRLHSLIVAALLGVPSVAIAYDPKIDGMMAALGRQGAVIPLEQVERVDISDLLITALSESRTDLTERVALLRGRAADERAAILAAALER
jgi:polysaccharide pyruvyl transferase WcaK-like protein